MLSTANKTEQTPEDADTCLAHFTAHDADARLARIADHIAATDARLAQYSARSRKLQHISSFAAVLSAIAVVAVSSWQVVDAQKTLDDASARLQEIATQEQSIKERIDALERTNAYLKSEGDKLKAEADKLDRRLASLKRAVDITTDPSVEAIRAEYAEYSPADRAQALWRRGLEAYKRRDLKLAEALYLAAVSEVPDYPNALNGLGRVAAERHEFQVAERFYKVALDKDPNYSPSLLNLAIVYSLDRRWNDALSVAALIPPGKDEFEAAQELIRKIQRKR